MGDIARTLANGFAGTARTFEPRRRHEPARPSAPVFEPAPRTSPSDLLRRLGRDELDDDISDLFTPEAIASRGVMAPVVFTPAAPAKAPKASKPKADPKPRARKAKVLPALPPIVLQGRDVPVSVSGTVAVTGHGTAHTGPTATVSVTWTDAEGRTVTAAGIVAWAGRVQDAVLAAAASGASIGLEISHPENERFSPSAKRIIGQ